MNILWPSAASAVISVLPTIRSGWWNSGNGSVLTYSGRFHHRHVVLNVRKILRTVSQALGRLHNHLHAVQLTKGLNDCGEILFFIAVFNGGTKEISRQASKDPAQSHRLHGSSIQLNVLFHQSETK